MFPAFHEMKLNPFSKCVLQHLTYSNPLFDLSSLLTFSLPQQITKEVTWLMMFVTEFQNNIVAAERIKEFAEYSTETDSDTKTSLKIPPEWPENGNITFKNYELRYDENADPVLKKITLTIHSSEKVRKRV